MSTNNRLAKQNKKSIKDFAKKPTLPTKCKGNQLSPPVEKSQKKKRSSLSPQMDEEAQPCKESMMNMETNQTSSASVTSTPTPTPNKIVDESAPEANLQGTLGPLVQEIKLLRESFNETYATLSNKYT